MVTSSTGIIVVHEDWGWVCLLKMKEGTSQLLLCMDSHFRPHVRIDQFVERKISQWNSCDTDKNSCRKRNWLKTKLKLRIFLTPGNRMDEIHCEEKSS